MPSFAGVAGTSVPPTGEMACGKGEMPSFEIPDNLDLPSVE